MQVTGLSTTASLNPATPAQVTGPPSDPFAGTPAEAWADGAAGIVIPQAQQTGPYTAAQVQAAYETTRQLLIAAHLDPQTLNGGLPVAYANLLQPLVRNAFWANLNTVGVNNDGAPLSTRAWVTSFAPGTTVLIGNVIKVAGTMSAQPETNPLIEGGQALDIVVNYRFVYPVEPPGDPGAWMRVVGIASGKVRFSPSSNGGPLLPWDDTAPAVAGARCDSVDGYVHPDYANGPPENVQASGPPFDPYDLNEVPAGYCQETTGT